MPENEYPRRHARRAKGAGAGVLDLSALPTRAHPLDDVNDALAEVKRRPGGQVNIVVHPDR
jgi:hypothetical protein